MKIKDVIKVVEGKLVSGENLLEKEVSRGFASDLMSDVLTLDSDSVVLITGLSNTQALRTAEMSDISCIVIARNKKTTPEMMQLAEDADLVMIECSSSVFKAVGKLYKAGLKAVY